MSKLVTNDNLKAYHAELAEHIKLLQRNTTYALNDIVNYDGIMLKCTTAGTTNTTKPNISSLSVGSTYTDGTCVWTRIDPDKRGIDYWAVSTTYALNDQVVNDNKIYKCSTAHTSTSTFDATKWTEISAGGGGSIDEWASGTSYSSGDLVIKDNVLYKANTTTSTTWVESEWDLIGTTFNTTSTYAQKIVTNVVAPYEMLLQVGDSNYCKPPIDVLKKTGGSDNVTLTLENYNNASAYTGTSNFLKIENSKAKLYNYKEYPITSQTLSTIDIGVSDEIDFGDFYGSSGTPDSNTLVLLHFDNDINDEINNIWTPSIAPTYNNGKFNNSIDNSADNLYISTTNLSADLANFMNSDFTIDWWWSRTSTPSICGIVAGGYGYFLFNTSSNNFQLGEYGASTQFNINANLSSYADGVFHHYALVKNNTDIYAFIDGIEIFNTVMSYTYTQLTNLYILGSPILSAGNQTVGYIDEFRISNIARWTSNFTPPTEPYARYNYNIFSLEVN